MSVAPIRVVVGDDDPLYRAGIVHVLRDVSVDVVATASNARDLALQAQEHHPDVAVVDIDMPPSVSDDDRVQVTREIRAIDPQMAVLILSEVADAPYARAALGDHPEGFGCLLKARIRDVEDFTSSVRRVARGGTAIDPLLVAALAGNGRTADPLAELTTRERQVIALIADGRSNSSIADELAVTVAAVERHVSNIFAKLDLRRNPADHRRVLTVLRYLRCHANSSSTETRMRPGPPVAGAAAGSSARCVMSQSAWTSEARKREALP
jgi:DNA-binding NarL/FixJ family response regulator